MHFAPTILLNQYKVACEFYLKHHYSFLINLLFLKITWPNLLGLEKINKSCWLWTSIKNEVHCWLRRCFLLLFLVVLLSLTPKIWFHQNPSLELCASGTSAFCLQKNHTHVKKVGHTSEFPFCLYQWTWKTTIKKTVELGQ